MQQVTGSNGDCSIPANATAVAMNVTFADPDTVLTAIFTPAA